jgi:hypothetical protein
MHNFEPSREIYSKAIDRADKQNWASMDTFRTSYMIVPLVRWQWGLFHHSPIKFHVTRGPKNQITTYFVIPDPPSCRTMLHRSYYRLNASFASSLVSSFGLSAQNSTDRSCEKADEISFAMSWILMSLFLRRDINMHCTHIKDRPSQGLNRPKFIISRVHS